MGAALEAAIAAGYLAYALTLGDRERIVSAGVGAVAWVSRSCGQDRDNTDRSGQTYAAARILMKPPPGPPYLLIILYLVYASISGVRLSLAFIDGPLRADHVLFDLLHLCKRFADVCLRLAIPVGVVGSSLLPYQPAL